MTNALRGRKVLQDPHKSDNVLHIVDDKTNQEDMHLYDWNWSTSYEFLFVKEGDALSL